MTETPPIPALLPPTTPLTPVTPPSATAKPFAIKRAKAGRGGRIALTLAVPATGGVRVTATATVGGRRLTWSQSAKARTVKAGTRSLTIMPTAAARNALMRARRAVRVALRVTFTPRGGRAVVRTTTVSVRR